MAWSNGAGVITATSKGSPKMRETPHCGRFFVSALHATLAQRTLYLLVLSFAILITFSSVPARAAEKLTPERVKELLPQFFQYHLREREMNGPFMKRVLKEYVNQLDPAKSFFLKPEADALVELSPAELTALATQAIAGDFSHFTKLLNDFLATQIARDKPFYDGLEDRAEEIKALSKEKPKTTAATGPGKETTPEKAAPALSGTTAVAPLNGKETAPQMAAPEQAAAKDTAASEKDPPAAKPDEDESEDGIKWNERPLTQAERETRMLKAAAAFFRVNRSYMSDKDALAQALLTVRDERKHWLAVKVEDEVPKLFLKSFMQAMDPHTAYMDADEDEEFTSRLEPSFAGIGVQIRPCPLGAFIEDIIEGGPSERSGKLARGDQIVSVDDASLAGLSINKIVRRIKGKKGTEVKLTILKLETKKTENIALLRDTIKLGTMRVKPRKFETPAGLVGMVSVQTFYRSENDPDGHTNGVSEELRDRILSLSKDQPLAGLVLDLRDNHGGYLEEAVALAGLFIPAGPVVGERDRLNKVDWKPSPGSMVYSGPLVILVNQFSASASEIVAGALKDYGRAVIISSTQTFGKGTVQRVLPLSGLNLPGEVKITTHQYYLPGGASVQQKGVTPDVVIPGLKLYNDLLEKAAENSIPWDKIPGKLNPDEPDVSRWTEWKKQNLSLLQEKSSQRVASNTELKDFFDLKKRRSKLDAETQADKARNPDEAPPLADLKKQEKDPVAEEAAAVVQDMVATWPKPDKQAVK